jgi:hypothetical protein
MTLTSEVLTRAILQLQAEQLHQLLKHGSAGSRTAFTIPAVALLSIVEFSSFEKPAQDAFDTISKAFTARMAQLCKHSAGKFCLNLNQRTVLDRNHICYKGKIAKLRNDAAKNLVRDLPLPSIPEDL